MPPGWPGPCTFAFSGSRSGPKHPLIPLYYLCRVSRRDVGGPHSKAAAVLLLGTNFRTGTALLPNRRRVRRRPAGCPAGLAGESVLRSAMIRRSDSAEQASDLM